MLWQKLTETYPQDSEKLQKQFGQNSNQEIYGYLLSYKDDLSKLAANLSVGLESLEKLKQLVLEQLPKDVTDNLEELSKKEIKHSTGYKFNQ